MEAGEDGDKGPGAERLRRRDGRLGTLRTERTLRTLHGLSAGTPRTLHGLRGTRNAPHVHTGGRPQCTGSCPNLMMSRSEHADARPIPVALTPQLPPRAHRPLCMSVSSDSSGRFRALETQEWKNNLKAQMEQAHSAGAASSTGSLERASLFCASASTTASSSSLSSPVEILNKSKSSSRFSLFSPPWNSSSESDSNPPSRSGSKKLRNYSRRAATGPAGARGPDTPEPKPSGPEHFQYSEPVISKVTDYIYVGNLNAAYNGRTLCRNNIDSIIDMSSVPGSRAPASTSCRAPAPAAPATAGPASRWTSETCRTPWATARP
ncbi:uncharacterized protein LOC129108191 [Anoplopoma fimbria]|uniref:uncharacterized protein LOC129108191 n=1 Tax=Anoplopoma fimbria TaxID=229290 RepID=UPI0023ECA305|nr:uncharacterized protein LOC129108191 [Anoplopoma fimbria]